MQVHTHLAGLLAWVSRSRLAESNTQVHYILQMHNSPTWSAGFLHVVQRTFQGEEIVTSLF